MLWWFFFWREDSGGWKEKIMIRIMLVSPYADTKDRGESSCDIWWWRSRQLFKGNKDTAVSIILIDKLIFSLKSSPGRLGTFFWKFKRKVPCVGEQTEKMEEQIRAAVDDTQRRTPAFFWMDSDRIVCLIGPVDGLWAVRICCRPLCARGNLQFISISILLKSFYFL